MLSVEYDAAAAGSAHRAVRQVLTRFRQPDTRPRKDADGARGAVRRRCRERPDFPSPCPRRCSATTTARAAPGILITERIPFGSNGIERQYHKCLDYEMPEPLEHYRALLTALARLAGTHRSGRAAGRPDRALSAGRAGRDGGRPSAAVSPDELDRRLNQLAEFAEAHPGLLPANVGSAEFLSRLRADVPRIAAHEDFDRAPTRSRYRLCRAVPLECQRRQCLVLARHRRRLHCGLMDWGCVSQMNMGMALWGAMSGAETALWDRHLDELLHVFVSRSPSLRRSGSRPGPVATAHPALRGDDGGGLATGCTGVDTQAIWRFGTGRSHRPAHQG